MVDFSRMEQKKPSLLAQALEFSIASLRPEAEDIAESRRACERSLHEYIRQSWHVIEPETPFIDGWVVGCFAEHLQAMANLEIRNLLVSMPPRFLKSISAAICLPTWRWTKFHGDKFIFGSFSADFAKRDSNRSRRLIESKWYQERWGHKFELVEKGASRLVTNKAGHRLAVSVSGQGVGEGADWLCLSGDSVLETDCGCVAIKDVVDNDKASSVLAFDHITNQRVYKKITSRQKRPGRPCKKISFSNGATIIATTNHPVFVVGKGYVPVDNLQVGDEIVEAKLQVPVRHGVLSVPGTSKKKQVRPVLFSRMPREGADWRRQQNVPWRGRSATMPEMPKGVFCQTKILETWPWQWEVLLQGLSRISNERQTVSALQKSEDELRQVQENDKCYTEQNIELQASILFTSMRGFSAQKGNEGHGQPELHPRNGHSSIRCRIHGGIEGNQENGRMDVRYLFDGSGKIKVGRAPRELRSYRSSAQQSSVVVQGMSQQNTSRAKMVVATLAGCRVVSIEDAPQPEFVYNISVEGTENYFANGILTHNCGDDILKPIDAKSVAARTEAILWWTQTINFRGNNPNTVRKLLMMHRLHRQDPIGHLLTSGANYEYLCLPMEHEPKRIFFTKIEAQNSKQRDPIVYTSLQVKRPELQDPRQEEGESLWPERYSHEAIEALKSEPMTVSDGTAGQLQQRPGEEKGNIFNSDDFRVCFVDRDDEGRDVFVLGQDQNGIPAPRVLVNTCRFFQIVDTAIEVNPTSKYTAVLTLAVARLRDLEGNHKRHLIVYDAWRARLEIRDQLPALYELRDGMARYNFAKRQWDVKGTSAPWPRTLTFQAVEKKASGPGLIQDARADGRPLQGLGTDGGGKVERAAQAVNLYRCGLLWHYSGMRNLGDFENELKDFPGGLYSDWVDCIAHGARKFYNDRMLTVFQDGEPLIGSQSRRQSERFKAAVYKVGDVEVKFDDD